MPEGAQPLDHLAPFLATSHKRPLWPQNLNWTNLAFVLVPSSNHQRTSDTFSQVLPLKKREGLIPGPSPQEKGRTFPIIGPKGCRNLEWGIYGLRYHYAPFFSEVQ
ncbi:hypothetical protein O181_003069 [Austropuccinia psidii MF-1]|uniref:Uncharacterized protein n=1 Tax=Austropuccinia psidii MF-1 TaxID=1389203 RepID=A0A9Q3BDN0_9BASI|nr:hypothetical protein [Austropuccinia psidii MF-1]